MKNIISILLFVFTTVSSINSFASKCCYCEIGNYPQNQQGFFKMGCNLWLGSQRNCDVKEIVPQNSRYDQMDLQCKNGDLVVGYVGHWGSSYETVDYLQRSIVPVIKNQNVSVKVDNTACLSMSSPKVVFDFVKSLNLPEGKNLSVVGNQVISIGKWDTLLGSSINFGAMVSADKEDIQYPSCKKFRGYACVQQVQMFQSGTCIEENKQLSRLTCCGVDEMSQGEASGMTKKYIWTEKNNCSSSL